VSEARGRLIALEGTEGAGKSTHVRLLAESLRGDGYVVRETREPGGTPLGLEIRRIVIHEESDVPTPLAELLLYLADRAQHLDTVIRPALAAGEIVVTDRFSASTIAYQSYGRGLDLHCVTQLDAIVRGDVAPDLVIVLDSPVEVALQRAQGDDRFHRAQLDFHERVRRGFLQQAREAPDGFRVIDVTRPCGEVAADVLRAVRERVRHA
jgi:dTMP kinase